MVDYFQTAPIPTALAWYAHWLPESWHHLESRFTLFFECFLPFALFFGKWGRRIVLVVFTGFQLINFATANYGFFIPLALALHLWLLEVQELTFFQGPLRAGVWIRIGSGVDPAARDRRDRRDRRTRGRARP